MTIADTFRAATRPAVTIIFAAVIAQIVTEKIDAPDWYLAMASVVILEWWGERTVKRIKETKQSNKEEA
jgi:hypothetical protein